MRILYFFLAILMITVPYAGGEVLINEVDSDQSGTDVEEFVELYNTDGSPVDLAAGGYVLVLYNGFTDTSYQATDLTGTIAANGYYIVGATDIVPNVDLVPAGWYVQNGPDAVALYSGESASNFPNDTPVTATNLVDAVVYDTADADDTGLISVLTPGQPQIDEDGGGSKDTESIQRDPDGAGGALNTGSYATYPPTPGAANGPAGITTVADIDEARAQSLGAVVRITGTVVVTSETNGLNDGRHQVVVQDSSGVDGQSAIFVDDPGYSLGVDYSVGDQLQNLTGLLATYAGMLELVPSTTASLVGSTTSPTALVLDSSITDFETIEAELVQIEYANVTEMGTWAAPISYAMTAPGGLVIDTIRIEDNSTAVGETIPLGLFHVTGIAYQFVTSYQIQPRFATDIQLPEPETGVEMWELYQ
jgi:hypothetical protein